MKHRLELLATFPVEIVWHENKSSYLSVKKGRGRLFLRVHRLFYDAPTPVLEALLKYALKRDRDARAVVRQMAHLHFSQNRTDPRPLTSVGKAYDLQEIFERMRELLPVEGVSIGWSNRQVKGKFRSMTFGTYDHHTGQIRINPFLDDREVPLYFLEYIVYHEMLHDLCPTQMDGSGRCSIHTREFREREKLFPRFQEAKGWEKQSLPFFKKRHRGRS